MAQNPQRDGEPDHGASQRTTDSRPAPGQFPNTRWSVVLSLGDGDGKAAADALGHLCRMYWFPLYAYARRRGHPHHEAEDLTQEFFHRLLERDSFADARKEKGRLRSFLLTLMKRFLANEWKKKGALKRGGGQVAIPIDEEWAEDHYRSEAVDSVTPEDLFERQWALTLLDGVLDALRAEYIDRDKETLYESLKDSIARNSGGISYAVLAAQLDMSAGAVRVAVHRMRARYKELLLREIERTVESPEDIEDEIRHLFATFNT